MANILIKERKKYFSLKKNAIIAINEGFKILKKCMPSEFARKQRSLNDIEYWKATEFRIFLYATQGLWIFKNIVEDCNIMVAWATIVECVNWQHCHTLYSPTIV